MRLSTINPLSTEVVRGIASHDKVRHGVAEIPTGPQRICETDEGNELLPDDEEPGNTRE